MAKAHYEVWLTDKDYREDVRFIPFEEVNIKKEIMKVTSFYFRMKRNAEAELTAPKVGDFIKIYRNNEEVLRGKIRDMKMRDTSILFEGFSVSAEWLSIMNGNQYFWKDSSTQVILGNYASKIGWTLKNFQSNTVKKHEYAYLPLLEEVQHFADIYNKEFMFHEKTRELEFKSEIGKDTSSTVRFIRGVNIESFEVNMSEADKYNCVVALGEGEGKNQLKVVVGDTSDKANTKVFVDKRINSIESLTNFANKMLAEGQKPARVVYKGRILSPVFVSEIGDKVWIEDSLNRIDEAMRILSIELSFNETEQYDVVFANRDQTMIDFFKKMELGQRTLNQVNHSSAVQPNSMLQVDPDTKDPIRLEVKNDNFVNTSTGNSIGVIENNVDTAQSVASSAQTDATNALTTANTAISNASTANALLAELSDDNKLSPIEKQNVKKEWDIIVAEKPTIEAQATTYGITTEKTNFTNSYNTLNTYVSPLLSNLTTTSNIVGTTFRANFKDYYDKKTLLLKKIADTAKTLADTAQGTANTANGTANNALSNANNALSAISNLNIGGRNLVTNSTFRNEESNWSPSSRQTVIDPEADKPNSPIMHFQWSEATRVTTPILNSPRIQISFSGTVQFTASCDFYIADLANWDAGNDSTILTLRVIDAPEAGNILESYSLFKSEAVAQGLVSGKWVRLSKTFNITKSGWLTLGMYQHGLAGNYKYRELQLEEGNKATAWMPNPDEADINVKLIENRVTSAEEILYSDSIVQTVISSTSFENILGQKADASSVGEMVTPDQLETAKTELLEEVDGKIGSIDFSPFITATQLEQTTTDFKFLFSKSGGVNLLKNSTGFAGNDFWTVNTNPFKTEVRSEFDPYGGGSGFVGYVGTDSTIYQVFPTGDQQTFTVSFYMNKTIDNATNGFAYVYVIENGVTKASIGRGSGQGVTNGYQKFTHTFTTTQANIEIRVRVASNAEASITGLMVNVGDTPLQWTMAQGEVANASTVINGNGIRVNSNTYNGYTVMSPEEFSGYAEVMDFAGNVSMRRIFTLNGATTEVKELKAESEIVMTPISVVPIISTQYNGWAFVPSG